jgi:single-stranded DNA-binding protein
MAHMKYGVACNLHFTKGSMIFVQGHFTPREDTTEDGKQGVSLEVNVEKFSFAGGSQPQENGQQSVLCLNDTCCAY